MRPRVESVIECRFRLDGGAMFGVVPKPLWSRSFPSDDRNRVALVCRVLLVEGDGYLALVDVGMGDGWSEKERDLFGLEAPDGIEHALAARGLRTDDVTDVVLTHLHFDHAGGIVRADGSLRFAGATHHVQRANLDWARSPTQKDSGSYRPATLAALGRARLRVLEGPGEVLPSVRARLSGGHTEGLQLITIDGAQGPVVFAADLVPTRAHVHLPWIMAYDNHPLRMLEEKRALFEELSATQGCLVLEHDPEVEAVRVRWAEDRWASDPVALRT